MRTGRVALLGIAFALALTAGSATVALADEPIRGYHVVRPGETVYCIARAYGVHPGAIAAQNGLVNPSLIHPGLRLAIPAAPATIPAGPVCEPQFGTTTPCACVQRYVIAWGDTLTRICLRFGVNLWHVVQCNGIGNPNTIRAGDTLCVPGATTAPATIAPSSPSPTPAPFTATPVPTPSPSFTPTCTPTPAASPTPAGAVTPTVTSTSAPAVPTVTPTPAEGPLIVYFRADVTEADPGDTITLEWLSTGGTRATLLYVLPTGQYSRMWEVETAGSMEYAIAPEHRNAEYLQLFVYDDADRRASGWLTVTLRCPDTWFFTPAPDECPAAAAVVTAGAEQHFERGVMLWNEAENRILVLFGDAVYPHWRSYANEWQPGDQESDPSLVPPAGLEQPVRGFGLVWREQPDVRERLGWAVGTEGGYTTAMQRTSRPKYNDTYVKAQDGGVWKLGPEGSEWSHIP